MKKFIASSVLASSILFPTFANAENLTFPVKLTVEKKVEIRKGATTSYSVVKTLNSGTQVTVIDQFKNTMGETWYRVDLGSVKGWGNSSMFSQPKNASTSDLATVNNSDVNIRKGATTSYPSIGKLQKGMKVKIIDQFTNSFGELWYRIDSAGTIGWVHSNYLTLPSSATTPANTKTVINPTPIRKGATTSYATVGSLSKNQKVIILDTFTNSFKEVWYRVQVGTILGWVPKSTFETETPPVTEPPVTPPGTDPIDPPVTEPSQPTDPTNPPVTTPGPDPENPPVTNPGQPTDPTNPPPNSFVGQSVFVGTKNAALYADASYSSKVLEIVPYYSKVTVLNEIIVSPNQEWVQLVAPDGKTGWTRKFELIGSAADQTYVYAVNSALIRKGAATSYASVATLKGNDKLLYLQEINGWLNVETTTGIRGWILKSDTSPTVMKGLAAPFTYADQDNNNYLVWRKATNFKLTYSTNSSNQLILTNGITDVELPAFNVPGIRSVSSTQKSATEKSAVITFEPGYTFTLRNYADKVTIKVIPTSLVGKKIIIDAGHGGKDTGAIGPTGLREKDANLATALLLKAELEKAGATVILTRSTDIFLELWERTDIANNSDADLFISLHSDSFSSTSTGSTTYYNSTVNFNGPRSKQLGDVIQRNLIGSLNTYNRGVKEQEFYVNRMNALPSILIEMAYISNPNEEAMLRSTAFRQKVAVGVANGLKEYFSRF